jgi:general secretion pathway protein N
MTRHRALQAPRAGRWAFAGAVLGLLLGILAFAPASWLAQAMARATGERLLLQDARGTVWAGSARWVLAAGEGATDAAALPGRVAWSLSPTWDGALLRLEASCCATTPLTLRLARVWSGPQLQLSDTVTRWPAAVLVGLGAPLEHRAARRCAAT